MKPLSKGIDNSSDISFSFENDIIWAKKGESVASAILAARPGYTGNNPVDGRPRAPYCLMGVCFECQMEIDGQPNQRACQVEVRQNMNVRRQTGIRSIKIKEADK